VRKPTGRSHEQEPLKASEQRYDSLYSHMLNGLASCLMIHDKDGRPVDFEFLGANEAFERLTGLSNVVGKRVSEVVPGILELSPELLDTYARVASTGTAETFDFDFKSQNQWLSVCAYSDKPGTFVAVFEDITARKHAEADMLLQGAALNASADAMVIADRDGTIAWVNPAFTTLTGYQRHEAIGKTTRLLKSGEHDPAFYRVLWETVLAGQVWRGELVNRRKDGVLYTEAQTITPVTDDAGAVTHFVAIKRDLTQQKQLERQFLQAQRMESVGRLAGGVAHDFNNLLTVINGRAELASLGVTEGEATHSDLQEILHAGWRAVGLTRQLLAFSRKQVLQPMVVTLATVVADVKQMLGRVIGEDVELVFATDPDLGRVKVDPGQMEQVIMNLVVNARDAMPRGGRLTIATHNVDLDLVDTRSLPSVKPGPHVMLEVTDTGVGMDAATRERIFEPFFTTKGPTKGTGLGLSTVYGIIKQSGGSVWVDSAQGKGTTVRIYLPRVDEMAHAMRPAVTAANTRGTETILVVEDEDAVCALTRRMLESAGYNVLVATGGEQALPLLAQHADSVDLLFTDVVMPGMSGQDVAARVAELCPRIKVLYTSGYTDDTIGRHGVLDPDTRFISKPYGTLELTRKVRETLDA
jgi:two-component system, cell cycle sensor histidine kinase and response regulator CckA